jgi:LmbE family N-acetylglucosaminyl deacetylase
MKRQDVLLQRREFFSAALATAAAVQTQSVRAQEAARDVYFERPLEGQPHKGKVLLAVQAHSDDIPLTASGTVAKLVKEGYSGYLVRATNDDMGDAPGLGTPGSVGDHVLGNERDNAEVARVLGLKRVFDLNYGNHRMGDVPLNELICRLIFLVRLLKVDTVVCWDPWAHDEENPDHWQIARGIEAACWMAGRPHDYPEQLAVPGITPHAVQDKYYYARRPEITRIVDVSGVVDQIIDCNRANKAKGPAGSHGSQLRAELARRGRKLPLLGDDDVTADRNYIKQFILTRRRELGQKYGVEYAEAFHYVGSRTGRRSAVDEYVDDNAVPIR